MPSSDPAHSDSTNDMNELVVETTGLLAEFHPSEVRTESTKRGLKVKGKQMIIRAISGFSFTKNGLPWKPRPSAISHGDLVDVLLTGYVASLTCAQARPIVLSGYWDIEDYEVERYRMELRPENFYAGVSKHYRAGEWALWADTQHYSYVLTAPSPEYSGIWTQVLQLEWREDSELVLAFRDLRGSDNLPSWWPLKDKKRFNEFRALIRREERALNPEPEGSNSRRSARKGKARQDLVVEAGSDGNEPETSKRPKTRREPRAPASSQPTSRSNGKGKGKAPPEDVVAQADNSGAPSGGETKIPATGMRPILEASGSGESSREQALVSSGPAESSPSAAVPSRSERTSGAASGSGPSMAANEQTQEPEHAASADSEPVADPKKPLPQPEPRATYPPVTPAPPIIPTPPEPQGVQPSPTDDGRSGLASAASQAPAGTFTIAPGSGAEPDQRSPIQGTPHHEEPTATVPLGSNEASEIVHISDDPSQYSGFSQTSTSDDELVLAAQGLVDQLMEMHGPEIMEGLLAEDSHMPGSSQVSITAPPCPPDFVSHSVGPSTQSASNIETGSQTASCLTESVAHSVALPSAPAISTAAGSQPGPSASFSSTVTNPLTPSKRPLDEPTVTGRVSAPPAPSTSGASEAGPHSDMISDMLPELSYDRFEDTFLAPDQELEPESPGVGETVVVYEGRYVFRVSRLNGKYGRELYLDIGNPWDGWNSSGGVIVAKQFLALDLKDMGVVGSLVSPELLSLYTVGVMVPESSRGPLQKRLVSRIAILARDGHLPGRLFSAWMEIQLKLNSWLDEMDRAPPHIPFRAPDVSQLVLDAQFENYNPPPRS